MASRLSGWQLLLLGLVVAGCSSGGDDGGDSTQARSSVLNFSAGRIAQLALGDTPDPDFVNARTRVQRKVPTERVTYARKYTLGAGRMPITTDPIFAGVRLDAATALGTAIDAAKANDSSAANLALDALLTEIVKLNPTATSCDALPSPKNDACAFALIIIDVLRSEAPLADAGTTVLNDAGGFDSSTPDSGPVTPVGLLSCGTRDLTGAVTAASTIAEPTTWSGKVIIAGTTYVNANLTIAPGTEIYLQADSAIEFGWSGPGMTLTADGTAALPIKFCGTTGSKGFWAQVTVNDGVASNSVLRNVLFSDGGGTDAALQLEADITVDNVQVRNAAKDGAWAIDFAPNSQKLSVEGAGGNALALTGPGAVTRFPLGGILLNNTANLAVVRFTSIDTATTFHNLGIPYAQEADVYQRGDITFEAGVDYRLNSDRSLLFAWSGTPAVHVNGTATAPVKFSAAQGVGSPWTSLQVNAAVTSNSNFTYVEISQGGSNAKPALELLGAVLLDNVKLSDNTTGLTIGEPGVVAGSKQLTVTKTKGAPVTAATSALYSLPQGGTYTGNDLDQIIVTGSTFASNGSIADLGIPYRLEGTIYTNRANIVVAPGTDFVLAEDAFIEIAWSGATSFVAKGTAAQPITFTGVTATAGSWKGIHVSNQAVSSSAFDYVQIGHAGGGGEGALQLDIAVPVTNSKFFTYTTYGITKPASVTVDYLVSNTFDGMTVGTN